MFLLCPIIHRCTAFRISFFTMSWFSQVFVHILKQLVYCLRETDTSAQNADGNATGKVFWVTDAKDVYNRSAVMLVERFSPLGGDYRGTLQIVLKDEAFESIDFDNSA